MKSDLNYYTVGNYGFATNPTPVTSVRVYNTTGSPLAPGSAAWLTVDRYSSPVWDCTTRYTGYSTVYTLNGQQWYGYKESKKGKIEQELSDKLTVLAHKKK